MMIEKLRRSHWFARRDEGVTTLEIVIVFPVFFAALMLVFQAAIYHYTAQVALAAAQKGARLTATELSQPTANPAQAVTDGTAAAKTYLLSTSSTGFSQITVAPAATSPGVQPAPIQFVVTAKLLPLPFLPQMTLTISRDAIANPEIFTHG